MRSKGLPLIIALSCHSWWDPLEDESFNSDETSEPSGATRVETEMDTSGSAERHVLAPILTRRHLWQALVTMPDNRYAFWDLLTASRPLGWTALKTIHLDLPYKGRYVYDGINITAEDAPNLEGAYLRSLNSNISISLPWEQLKRLGLYSVEAKSVMRAIAGLDRIEELDIENTTLPSRGSNFSVILAEELALLDGRRGQPLQHFANLVFTFGPTRSTHGIEKSFRLFELFSPARICACWHVDSEEESSIHGLEQYIPPHAFGMITSLDIRLPSISPRKTALHPSPRLIPKIHEHLASFFSLQTLHISYDCEGRFDADRILVALTESAPNRVAPCPNLKNIRLTFAYLHFETLGKLMQVRGRLFGRNIELALCSFAEVNALDGYNKGDVKTWEEEAQLILDELLGPGMLLTVVIDPPRGRKEICRQDVGLYDSYTKA